MSAAVPVVRGPQRHASSATSASRRPGRTRRRPPRGVAPVPVPRRQPARMGARDLVPRRRLPPVLHVERAHRDQRGSHRRRQLDDSRAPTAAAGAAMRLGPQPGEVIDREPHARVPLERQAVPRPPRRHDRLGARRGRASGCSRAASSTTARAGCSRRLPRPGLPASRSATSPTSAAAHRLVEAGMDVRSQNTWPSLRFDVKAVERAGGAVPRAGFYYKTFIKPERLWPVYETGAAPVRARRCVSRRTPSTSTTTSATPTPTCWSRAAVRPGWRPRSAAARAGARVLLVEEEHQLGGHLRWGDDGRARRPAPSSRSRCRRAGHRGADRLGRASGRYDDNWIARRAARPARTWRSAWSRRGPGPSSWRPA